MTTQLIRICSPDQIAGLLRHTYPKDIYKHVSTETIYAVLYVLPRGIPWSELLAVPRQARTASRPRPGVRDRCCQLPNSTPIAERPVDVTTRAVPGHWEGGLGPASTRVGTDAASTY